MSEFGVSYPSIREAIRILETEGLVTVRRGNVGGAEVHRPDESSAAYHLGLALQGRRVTLGDLAAGLRLLEPLCAAECAQRRTARNGTDPGPDGQHRGVGAELTGDGVAFTRAAREFHDLLVTYTPNATVRHVIGSLVALWSSQEQTWAETMMQRGEYPSARRRRGRSRRTGASPPRSPPGTRRGGAPGPRAPGRDPAGGAGAVRGRHRHGLVGPGPAGDRGRRPTRS